MVSLERGKVLTQILHHDDQKTFYKQPQMIQLHLQNNK